MVRGSPKDMRTDRPECRVALVKGIVVEPLAHSPLNAEFPVVGETLFESDVPDMGGDPLIYEYFRLAHMPFSIA